jgi:hypothetical protein
MEDRMRTVNERVRLVAPCGIDCGNCILNTCTDDPAMIDHLVARGIPREKLPCAGCRNVKGNCPVIASACETFVCISQKEVEYCFQCADFPCSKLCPSAQRAEVLPHNMKVFNLCTIDRIGVEGFVKVSADVERLYFKGKMEIGKGPRLPQ